MENKKNKIIKKNEASGKINLKHPYLLEFDGWEGEIDNKDPQIFYKGKDALWDGFMEDSLGNADVRIIVNAKLSKRAILRIVRKLTDVVANDFMIDQLKVPFKNNTKD